MKQYGKDRVAIVTGASRGIGRGIAVDLARHGFSVVVNYASSGAEAQAVVDEIKSLGGSAAPAQADVGATQAGEQLFDAAERAFGHVDVVINNAGSLVVAPIARMDREAFDRSLAVNLGGTFSTMKQAATRLRDGGRIVNFSSTALHVSLPGYAAYTAAKAAIEAMTRVVAKELAERGITVNTVAPGPVATELFFEGKSEEMVERMKRLSPFGRLGTIDDIVPVVRFLCSPDATWVTGQIIRVNGGAG